MQNLRCQFYLLFNFFFCNLWLFILCWDLFFGFLLLIVHLLQLLWFLCVRDKILNFYFDSLLHYFSFALSLSEILRILDWEYFGEQNSIWRNKCLMTFVLLVKLTYLSWRSFWQSPEKFSLLCLHIKWICVKQLTNIVSEVLKENSNSLINALFKSSRSEFDHF